MGKWIIRVKCVKEKNEQGGMACQSLPRCPGGSAGEGREESQSEPGDIRAGGLVLGLPPPPGSLFPLPPPSCPSPPPGTTVPCQQVGAK